MPKLKTQFFNQYSSFDAIEFHNKLKAAIALIRQNKSSIAQETINVIDTKKVRIKSFFNLSKADYFDMKESFGLKLSNRFPIGDYSLALIEKKFNGILLDDKRIYICSNLSIEKMACALVHEICHFRNIKRYDIEYSQFTENIANYQDEFRAQAAEICFKKNGKYITRRDLRLLHRTVSKLYPEYVDKEVLQKCSGHIMGI